MCKGRTGDSIAALARCGRVSSVAVPASVPIPDSGTSPRPVPSLPPFKELDPNLVSDNPTNRLERHHHTNPKNSTLMPFLLSLARTSLKYTPASGRADPASATRRRRERARPAGLTRGSRADSFDQRWVRATAHRAARAMSSPPRLRAGLARVSRVPSAARNDSRTGRGTGRLEPARRRARATRVVP